MVIAPGQPLQMKGLTRRDTWRSEGCLKSETHETGWASNQTTYSAKIGQDLVPLLKSRRTPLGHQHRVDAVNDTVGLERIGRVNVRRTALLIG